MRNRWRFFATLVAALTLVVGACGDDGGGTSQTDMGDDTGGDTGGDMTPDTAPDAEPDAEPDVGPDEGFDADADLGFDADADAGAEFVDVTFTINDTANASYSGGLAWKGSFDYDEVNNILNRDPNWGGPYPLLFDDGTNGDETADDNIWTVTVQVEVTGEDVPFEYGAIQNYTAGSPGTLTDEWIWNQPSNGRFTVRANGDIDGDPDTAETIEPLTTLTLNPHGWVNYRFSIDTANLDADFLELVLGDDVDNITSLQVKSSAWGWTPLDVVDDGTQDDTASDGVYSFAIGANLGEDRPANAGGLGGLTPGQLAQFAFFINDTDYRDTALNSGVTVEVEMAAGWVPIEFAVGPDAGVGVSDPNGYFTVYDGWVALNFTIDDSANATYGSECAAEEPACDGLAWKGSMVYDYMSRTLVYDGGWPGPYPLVYDDGPWDGGGHEPSGATADDNIWGIAAWVEVTGSEQNFAYGAVRNYVQGELNNPETQLWIWIGDDGAFAVAVDQSEAIDVPGLTIPAFEGAIDLALTLDTGSLNGGFDPGGAITSVFVKGSAWGWSTIAMSDDGATMGDETASDGIWSFVLSEGQSIHDDLLALDQEVQFVFTINGTETEYKVDSDAPTDGVAAESDYGTPGTFVTETVGQADDGFGNQNTAVIIGSSDES